MRIFKNLLFFLPSLDERQLHLYTITMENDEIFLWTYTSEDGLIFVHRALNQQNDKGIHYYCRPSIHDNQFEIHFLKEGQTTYYIEGKEYVLPPFSFICVPKGHLHSVRSNLSNTKYDRYVLQFSENILPHNVPIINTLYKNLNGTEKSIIRIFDKQIVEKYGLDKFFYDIEAYASKEDKYFYPTLIASTINLLIDINKILETENISALYVTTHPVIQKVMDYVYNNNIEGDVSVKAIAKELYLSEGYLSHLFRKHIGMSLKQYTDLRKMRYASSLIDGGLNPTDVALRLGYMNYSTFYQRFLQVIQRKPSKTKPHKSNGSL